MKISYLISTYKSERFMDRRLRNLLSEQDDSDNEVIVIDSASPENEKEIVEKWQAIYPNRLKYICQEERTPYGVSWIRGWQIACGDFVCNANTDDFADPRFTGIVHREFTGAINQNKILRWCRDIGFAYTGIIVLNESGQVLSRGIKPKFDFDEYSHTCYGGPMLIWRNDKKFRESLNWDHMLIRAFQHRSAFDYWLALYFMSLGYHGYSIQELLTIYTQRPESIENSAPKVNNYETYASISEFFPHNFSSYLKHAKEFSDFSNLPPKQEWVEVAKSGKKWSI